MARNLICNLGDQRRFQRAASVSFLFWERLLTAKPKLQRNGGCVRLALFFGIAIDSVFFLNSLYKKNV